jgi:hypothetical protein
VIACPPPGQQAQHGSPQRLDPGRAGRRTRSAGDSAQKTVAITTAAGLFPGSPGLV